MQTETEIRSGHKLLTGALVGGLIGTLIAAFLAAVTLFVCFVLRTFQVLPSPPRDASPYHGLVGVLLVLTVVSLLISLVGGMRRAAKKS